MLGLLFLIFAFVLLILGLGSYRKRRQQAKARAFANQYHPQPVYNGYDPNVGAGGYDGPPPPVYNNQPGPMEAGLIQAPPPVYTPYEGNRKVDHGGEERGAADRGSKSRFGGWVRGG